MVRDSMQHHPPIRHSPDPFTECMLYVRMGANANGVGGGNDEFTVDQERKVGRVVGLKRKVSSSGERRNERPAPSYFCFSKSADNENILLFLLLAQIVP